VIRGSEAPVRAWVEWVIYYAALLTAIVVRNKKASIAALVILICGYVFAAVASFIQPVPL
jgi:hypothetical protein